MKSPPPRQPGSHESGIVQRVRKSLRALPYEHPHVLLACSGGKDSVALAWTLAALQRLDLISLSIAHIHHGQHDLADAAADTVTTIGLQLGVPVTIRKLSVESITAHVGVGREEAMRRERYLALATIARQDGADCIAVGHHQTDQAETVLLHLMRGSGLDGLTGMREFEQRLIPWWHPEPNATAIGIWRPFLTESADDVFATVVDSGLPVVEDPTNADTTFRRNAVRHELLPVIEGISPGSTGAIARAASLIASDAEFLEDLTKRELAVCLTESGLRRDAVMALPPALQRRVVRAWLVDSLPTSNLSFDRIVAVLQLATRNHGGAMVELGGGHTVHLHQGVLELHSWQNSPS